MWGIHSAPIPEALAGTGCDPAAPVLGGGPRVGYIGVLKMLKRERIPIRDFD
jgi:hypothetical protein